MEGIEGEIRVKNLLAWLASLFKVEVVWIEKEHGHWVKQRRYHPVTRAMVLVCVLFLVFSVPWRQYFFRVSREPQASEMEAPDEVSLPPPGGGEYATQPEMTDSLDPSHVYPGPIPDDLEIADDEYWLRVIKGNFKLYLYQGLDMERSYEVAVGRNPGDKERVGDNRTPNGIFTVQSIEDSRSWVYDFGDGNGPVRGAYGPWFIRLRTGWRGIGIHGTHDPDSLGTMVSEGCVRMHNYDLGELKQIAGINMKVVIEE